MDAFKTFELNDAQTVYGGKLVNTVYSNDGGMGADKYDTNTDSVIYF